MLHPVFITSDATRKVEIGTDPKSGRATITRSRVITQYLRMPSYRGVAHEDQPVSQVWIQTPISRPELAAAFADADKLYFHRPLHELFRVFFANGLVLDAMEEPTFTDEKNLDPRNPSDHSQIPFVFAFRLRRRN